MDDHDSLRGTSTLLYRSMHYLVPDTAATLYRHAQCLMLYMHTLLCIKEASISNTASPTLSSSLTPPIPVLRITERLIPSLNFIHTHNQPSLSHHLSLLERLPLRPYAAAKPPYHSLFIGVWFRASLVSASKQENKPQPNSQPSLIEQLATSNPPSWVPPI